MSSTVLSLLSLEAIQQHYRDGFWRDETIYQVAMGHALRIPERYAVRDRVRRLTWRQLLEATDRFAGDLWRRGLRPGNRVAFWMPDRLESIVALLACSRNGLVCCPSPHRNHTVADVAALMERMKAGALVHQSGFGADGPQRDIGSEVQDMNYLRHTYELPPLGAADAGRVPFAGMCMQESGAAAPPPATQANRVVYLAFTSGSTGNPKGVMHSDNTLLACPRTIVRDWRLSTESVVYSMSPFSHNLGIGALLTALVAGAEYVIHDVARAESLIDRLSEAGATYLVGVPTHAMDLLAEMRRRGLERLGSVQAFRVSGAASPRQVLADLLAHGMLPQSGYGMTETNAHQYTHPGDDSSLITETCGRACDGYEIRIFDPENRDVPLPPGIIGELGGRGASLMLGYFDDQVSTEACFNADGWFMTGDLGWIDDKGYLRLTGRKKEVIIRGGHNISPARIEELAMGSQAVERAAVLPIADPRLGERVCLALMFKAQAESGVDEVLRHLTAAGLSRYEMPEFTLELDDIPLMSNGKIQKQEILQWIRDGRAVPAPVRNQQKGGQ